MKFDTSDVPLENHYIENINIIAKSIDLIKSIVH